MMTDGDGGDDDDALFRQRLVQASAAMMADGDGDDGALLRQRLVQASEVMAIILSLARDPLLFRERCVRRLP